VEAQVRVDPRVELISVLFHLAGSPEYAHPFDTPYRRAVDEHFAAFRGHPAVAATRALRAEHGISHNAPISLAVELDADRLVPEEALDAPEVADDLDRRWRGVAIGAYLAQVRGFRAATGFDGFFASQAAYARRVEDRLARTIGDQQIAAWFESMFGPTGADVHLVPGLLTGPWNYEATTHDADGKHVYEVVEIEHVDEHGLPVPTDTTIDLIVHEMAHSYVNPVIEHHGDQFGVAAPVFDLLAEAMRRQGYGSWKTMVEESLVRAITILFVRERRGLDAARAMTHQEEQRGFQWIAGLSGLLLSMSEVTRPFALERKVPELAAFFEDLARRATRS
jgi:Domain of unknown function (DUF4932)